MNPNQTLCWILILIGLALPKLSMAQVDQGEDIAELLDDGGLGEVRNLLKLNPLPLLAGDLALSYERKISNRFTLEVTVGKILPYYVYEVGGIFLFNVLSAPSQDLNSIRGGYSFWFNPKVYLQGSAPEFFYFSPGFRFRRYNRESDYDLTFTDYSLTSGYNLVLGKRMVIETYTGLGARSVRYLAQEGSPDLSALNGVTFYLPLGIRFGLII